MNLPNELIAEILCYTNVGTLLTSIAHIYQLRDKYMFFLIFMKTFVLCGYFISMPIILVQGIALSSLVIVAIM